MRDKCILPFLITERLEFFQLTQADLPELEILLGDTADRGRAAADCRNDCKE